MLYVIILFYFYHFKVDATFKSIAIHLKFKYDLKNYINFERIKSSITHEVFQISKEYSLLYGHNCTIESHRF
jgi:hypothetical protein